jgi:SAM-dependent methyltransferase
MTLGLQPASDALANWPGRERRYPGIGDSAYLVLREITHSLVAARNAYLRPGARILDVGCGVQPYYPLFAELASDYHGSDIAPGPRVTYVSPVESLPAPDASYDLVLCTQVLEHVRYPDRALQEITRVLVPGGHLFLTTHGVYPFHPDPADYWRWTEDGLRAVIEDVPDLELVELTPHGGSASAFAVLMNTPIRGIIRSYGLLTPLGVALIVAINGIGLAVDRMLPGRASRALVPNYLVVARRASSK